MNNFIIMNNIANSFFSNIPILVCYSSAAMIGILIAVVELVSRYGSGNNPEWILLGRPQSLYYFINASAAMITLFISEAFETTTIVNDFNLNMSMAVIDSCKIGIASMFVLRSSLYSIERSDKKVKFDLGPAQILNILNRYLERQMDQNRGNAALREVDKIMKGFEPNLMDLTALCLQVPEAIPPEDSARLRKDVDILRKNSAKITPGALAIMMGLQLQKEVGSETLRTVVNLLKENNGPAWSPPSLAPSIVDVDNSSLHGEALPKGTILEEFHVPPETTQSDGHMLSLDEELTAKYEEFSGGKLQNENDGGEK